MSSNNENLAIQRIAKLVDENSFMEIGSLVTARSTDFNLTAAKTPSDGVVIGHGLIDGNLVFIYSQDASVLNGTIGEMHAKKIASVYDMAMKMGAPVIGLIDCGGIRLQESVDALDGFGTIYAKEVAASGLVPQICGVFGNCGGGLSVVPALCDFAFIGLPHADNAARLAARSPDQNHHAPIQHTDSGQPRLAIIEPRIRCRHSHAGKNLGGPGEIQLPLSQGPVALFGIEFDLHNYCSYAN